MGILLQDISSQNLLSRDISSQTFLHGNFVTGYFVTNPIWWIACNLGILSVLTVLAYDCKMASRENRSNIGPTWRSSGSVLCLSEILTSYVIRLFEISIFTEFKGGISKYRHPALRHWGEVTLPFHTGGQMFLARSRTYRRGLRSLEPPTQS